jgi:ssDNA-binding Zn-finger/Zn-ribbon topoisomerase 1
MTDNVWKVNSPKCNTTAAAEPKALKIMEKESYEQRFV